MTAGKADRTETESHPGSDAVDGRAGAECRNEVVLQGRVSVAAVERVLASGDTVLTTRIVVDRPAGSRDPARRRLVDAIDCAAWAPRVRQAMRRWEPGDQVRVEGAIRRRFFRREGAGPVSRFEVEVNAARRVRPRRRTSA